MTEAASRDDLPRVPTRELLALAGLGFVFRVLVAALTPIPSQELVLASVEAGAELVLPEWIRSELLREITGVKKYEPEALARARAKSADRSR